MMRIKARARVRPEDWEVIDIDVQCNNDKE
jgi:hypothetical protein